jgi:chromosome segregation ATPase
MDKYFTTKFMMIECLIGGTAVAAYIWSREDKKTEELIESLEDLRDRIQRCSASQDSYSIHRSTVTRDIQSLQGRIHQEDKLYEMLKVLQKEWKEVQDRHSISQSDLTVTTTSYESYYI